MIMAMLGVLVAFLLVLFGILVGISVTFAALARNDKESRDELFDMEY